MWLDISDLTYSSESESRNQQLLELGAYSTLLTQNDTWLTQLATKLYKKYQKLQVAFDDLISHVKSGFFLACKAYCRIGKFFDYAVFYILQYTFYQVFDEAYINKLTINRRRLINKLYSSILANLDISSSANYYEAIILAAEKENIPLTKAIGVIASCMQLSERAVKEEDFTDDVDQMNKWTQAYQRKEATVLDAPLPLLLTLMEAQMTQGKGITCNADPFKGLNTEFWKLTEVY